MIVELMVIGLIAGLIAGISPCILPVLPIVLMAGSTSGTVAGDRARRLRSVATIGGLVVSFSVLTLVGSEILSDLGLPQDLLRDAGLVLLGLMGLGLVAPKIGELLERPFARLRVREQRPRAGGFVLGLGLGAVFVPCAGPVLATIVLVGAMHHVGVSAVFLTLAFAVGAAAPLLAVALGGGTLVERSKALRERADTYRRIGGVVIVVMTVLIAVGALDGLQRVVPGYTSALQQRVEGSVFAREQLRSVSSETSSSGALTDCIPGDPVLESCGSAPAITGIVDWLNTPGDRPITLASLRGHVVLIDFWTYSCINCERALPHVEAWYSRYHGDGFEVIGVHTPEFAFEHVLSNVRAGAASLGVEYPIALDNNYATWVAYENEYWPADYLIDAKGVVRSVSFGEGGYATTETLIRQLLSDAHPGVALASRTDVPNETPTSLTTPETYLGYDHLSQAAALTVDDDTPHRYVLPPYLSPNEVAYGGTWNVHTEESTAVSNASIKLDFTAKDVYLVLGGHGTIDVLVNGQKTKTIVVAGVPRLYTLVDGTSTRSSTLELRSSPGVQAYDFTFG